MKENFPRINEKELKEVAHVLAQTLSEKASARAPVIALHGDLGSGKTTFSKAFIKGLGSRARVLSPTFVLMKRHMIKTPHHKNIYHFDWYRLTNAKEIRELGWKEMIENSQNIILIEWPSNFPRLLPKKRIIVRLTHDTEKTRNCSIEFHD